jgi:hypothetical protein
LNSRLFIALFFMAVIVAPIVAQHCLTTDVYAIELSKTDDSEKESSKKLLDDITKDWISFSAELNRIATTLIVSGLNAAYLLHPQRELFAVILDPPEDNKA